MGFNGVAGTHGLWRASPKFHPSEGRTMLVPPHQRPTKQVETYVQLKSDDLRGIHAIAQFVEQMELTHSDYV
jgi:hypothetical protein